MKSFTVETHQRTEFVDITSEVAKTVTVLGIKDGVITDPMPVLGVTAPADLHAAWAQSVAENIASYSFWRICGCERVDARRRVRGRDERPVSACSLPIPRR